MKTVCCNRAVARRRELGLNTRGKSKPMGKKSGKDESGWDLYQDKIERY